MMALATVLFTTLLFQFVRMVAVYIVGMWLALRLLDRYFDRRYERLHRLAGGIKYPECACWGCDIRHRLAAHGFKTTREAFSWKRALRTRMDYTWFDTPLRPVPGCPCKQCLRLLHAERTERARLRDEREAIVIEASPAPKPVWLSGGWP